MSELGRSHAPIRPDEPGGGDPEHALAVIGEACGLEFGKVKPLPGEHGAVEVAAQGHGKFIVKWTRNPFPWQDRVGEVTAALRRKRYPAPRIIAAASAGGLSFIVQEKLPGGPAQELDVDQLEVLIATAELHRDGMSGLPRQCPGMPWGEMIQRDLADRGHWTQRKRALALHSQQGREIVLGIEQRAARLDLSGLPDNDIVHGDFGLGNMLFLAGTLSGVIDWDGWRPGDHRADLVTLWFALRIGTDQTSVSAELRRHLRGILEPELFWAYAAHNVLRTLGWFALRHPGWDNPQWMAASNRLLRTALVA